MARNPADNPFSLRISVPLCVAKELFHRETQRWLREPRRKSPESNVSDAFLEAVSKMVVTMKQSP
jgi:hypothetical protein